MSHHGAKLTLLSLLVSLACFGQAAPVASPSSPPSPRSEPTAPLPPSPPDMLNPDPGALPKQEDKTKSPAKRAAARLAPLCTDFLFHSCVGIANGDVPSTEETDREFAKNLEVGDTYFKQRNYKGAESRYRDALEYKPDHAEATYKLAVSVDKLGKSDEAQKLFEKYLKLSPDGPYANPARKALHRKHAAAR